MLGIPDAQEAKELAESLKASRIVRGVLLIDVLYVAKALDREARARGSPKNTLPPGFDPFTLHVGKLGRWIRAAEAHIASARAKIEKAERVLSHPNSIPLDRDSAIRQIDLANREIEKRNARIAELRAEIEGLKALDASGRLQWMRARGWVIPE